MSAVRIALLGLGEAGSEIARDLVAAGADVRGYDPLVDPPSDLPPGRARVVPPEGVEVRSDEADAVRDADLVLSVNSSHDAVLALVNARPALRPGTVWADLNAAAPAVKVALVAELADTGVPVVDVALMAVVPGNGMHTPQVVSGEGAVRYAGIFADLGVVVQVVNGPAGAASSRKLLRSVFWKGTAAAVVEAMQGAETAGLADWLREDIGREMARFGPATVDRMVAGSRQHARRRADEMAAAAEQLVGLGVEPRVAAAARDQLAELRDRPERWTLR
ncbi:DUF1932 domain-containing protein [Geodermatophilus sp. YIM 151500]|uniref:DUF1932 domain-containing protein n=1 Tax=Geodermatophilus sp. YIM 151500 TaxID=2984531 RepID=UPI0021E48872|nr:NAD(P)-dependent oxidoreductase [Geodermatophilus sp. YIM 151500]MCV2487784.1 DUF1932 domain-containing protein [Geodermatophilus sp. YIM 151500]